MLNELDNLFLNSAYCSEKWAFRNLRQYYREHGKHITVAGRKISIEDQMRDEANHCRLLVQVLLDNKVKNIYDSPEWGMQNVIYSDFLGLDLSTLCGASTDPETFFSFHEIAERRAIWIYKTYLLGGRNESYKQVLRQLIKDEQKHIRPSVAFQSNKVISDFVQADKYAYLDHIPLEYGNNLLNSIRFWVDYYGPGLI